MPAKFQNLILKALAMLIRLHLYPSEVIVGQAARLAKQLEDSAAADLADL